MKIKSVPHNLPLENGRFTYYTEDDRIESSLDFILSFSYKTREYNSGFSTNFLVRLIQSPTSLIRSASSAFLLRLSALLSNSIPFFEVSATSFVPTVEVDRKSHELVVEYKNVEPDEVSPSPNLYARFL